ncbi:glycosyltransferase [Loktanella sp. SALINAS62]|uniref:glycosyltransferase n=1 Tax=Loktanella sp. SALINAS62 TaxID=2706124 RepID=UPI001B8BF59A|nr:glycosyltransferase [Loktanella sp. SALINAS62]MBS1302166.1 colanic acid biosynthesis glycosyltransferase WcaL [Loktanella sp. SALINAS62]
MRICIVADRFPLLSETFVIAQVKGLSARGHDVEVLCRETDSDWPDGNATVRLHWGKFAALNGPVQKLDTQRRHKAWRIMDRLDTAYLATFDVIIAHFGYEGARTAAVLRRLQQAPPLVTIYHGHDVSTVAHNGDMWIYKELFRTGALHLTVNAPFRAALVAAGAPAERTQVHHMGISPEAFVFEQRDWSARPVHILTVGRLTEKKGIGDAITALERFAVDHPGIDWRHDIIGTGELDAELRQQAAASPVADRITFLGARPHDEVRSRLQAAHIFLLPSVTAANGDAEGVPVSLMEAMSAGALVVSTDHSGIPELITDGHTGFLAPERDTDAIAAKIAAAALCADPAQIAQAAAAQVHRAFNTNHQLDALEQLLTGLCARRPDRPKPGMAEKTKA